MVKAGSSKKQILFSGRQLLPSLSFHQFHFILADKYEIQLLNIFDFSAWAEAQLLNESRPIGKISASQHRRNKPVYYW